MGNYVKIDDKHYLIVPYKNGNIKLVLLSKTHIDMNKHKILALFKSEDLVNEIVIRSQPVVTPKDTTELIQQLGNELPFEEVGDDK